MLVKHSIMYGFVNGFPGIINLVAIILFTRIVSASEFGEYSLCIAGVGLAGSVFYYWLRIGLVRFYPFWSGHESEFISTVFAGYIFVLIAITIICIPIAFAFKGTNILITILAGIILFIVQGVFEISQELFRITLSPGKYGFLTFGKSILALLLGYILSVQGFGHVGLLFGLIIGQLIPTLMLSRHIFSGVSFKKKNIKLLIDLFKYGFPLTATFAMTFVITSSDRFFINHFLGTEATGLYSVSYNLAFQALGLIMGVVNLAAYPLAVRALEEGGIEQARKQLSSNAILLAGVAFPAACGFALLSPNISSVFLGKEFHETAAWLMPWVSLVALLSGLKSYYFDLSFQLGCFTLGQFYIVLVGAVINVVSNIILIPLIGVLGAAISAVISYTVGISLSIYYGQKIFKLPFPFFEFIKIVVSVILMVFAVSIFMQKTGAFWLFFQVILGVIVSFLVYFILNVGGVQQKFSNRYREI